jgi:hypothetical protein
MPKVNLTRREWDWICMLLEDHKGYLSEPILKEISKQLDKQEH